MRQKLTTQSSPRDIKKIIPELFLVVRVIPGVDFEGCTGGVAGEAPAAADGLGVDTLGDELFGFAEELTAEDGDGGGAVSDFIVL